MTCTQVADRRIDRVVGAIGVGLPAELNRLDGVHAVFLGAPDLSESLMCAKCVGECKIF